ncbi:P-loop containing nucleoside triphosphate hydrolase protein [Flagelloscypha sp. PMI_526]|nr:P-loop containing nucleoside triphosphate hydrolase protein [Flagelloscypha sp. PMI_526]
MMTGDALKAIASEDSGAIIAVMGATGTGKTTFINLASGSDLRVGTGQCSCTSEVQVAQPLQLDGRSVTLVDTPGFDDTQKSNFDILNLISQHLSESYGGGTTLAGVVYLHRISDFRFTGMAAKNLRMFRQLCGDTTLKNVVIVTNMWGEVKTETGEARETELRSLEHPPLFKPVLDKGAVMLRHSDTLDSAHDILRHILKNHPEPLQIQREMVDEKKDLSQTAAGEELNRELEMLRKQHEKEMNQLRGDMELAIKRKDDDTRRELEAECRQLQEKLKNVNADTEKLNLRFFGTMERLEQLWWNDRDERAEEKRRQEIVWTKEKEEKEERKRMKLLQKEKEEQEREKKAEQESKMLSSALLLAALIL